MHTTPERQVDLTAPALGGGQDATAVLYQPVLDVARGEVVAVHARVLRPGLPSVAAAPAKVALDRLVLDAAARQVAAWHRRGLVLELVVDLSPAFLTAATFEQVLAQALAGSGLEPQTLVLVVPETAVEDDDALVAAALSAARGLGVAVAVGGYGTGSSTPAQLRQHDVAAIHLDRTCVAGLGTDPDAEGLAATVAGLARLLGARSVAVEVEEPEQHRRLVDAGVERAEGPLYAEAVAAGQLPAQVDRAEARAAGLTETPAGASPAVPERVLETMTRMWEGGASVQTIAAALNQMGSRHPSGRRWHGTSVGRWLADVARRAPARVR